MKKILIAVATLALIGLMAWPVLAASSALELVDKGAAAVTAGNFDQAVELLTKAIDGKGLSGKELARAYNERGKAFEAKSFWGQSLNDYRQAVWNDRQNKDYKTDSQRMRRREGSPL